MTWSLKTLDQIFEIARGGSPRPINQFITDADDGVNWIMIGDASNSSKHIRHTKKKIKPSGVSRSRLVKPGDFLLTNSMSFGRPYILDTHGCIHDGWLVLSPRQANVDHDYFYHLLGSPEIFRQFEKLAAGATVKNLNIDLVKSVTVALPPIEDQSRIAGILDQADELCRKRQRAIDRLNQLGLAIFNDSFGSVETDTSIIDYLDDIQSGKNLVGVDDGNGSGFRVLKISAVTRNGFRSDQTKPLPLGYVPPHDHLVTDGDLLFSRANTTQLVGIPCIVDGVGEDVALPDKLWRLVPNPKKAISAFVCHALLSQSARRQIEKMCSGTSGSMQNISMQKFKSIRVPKVSMEQQLRFQSAIDQVDAAKRDLTASRSRIDSLFQVLQHRAFSGAL